MNTGDVKRKPGRPVSIKNGRQRTIYIDDANRDVAKKLGGGSGSEGIRRALELSVTIDDAHKAPN